MSLNEGQQEEKRIAYLEHGRFRFTVLRKVSDEENVLIEWYTKTEEDGRAEMAHFLEDIRGHMVRYNEEVVLSHTEKLRELDAKIERKAAELQTITDEEQERRDASLEEKRKLERAIEAKRAELDALDKKVQRKKVA